MIVVADSSPLNYLVLLSHAELLHRFYDQVVVPEAVAAELSSPAAPTAVREWMMRPPGWLSIVPVDAARVLVQSGVIPLRRSVGLGIAVGDGLAVGGDRQREDVGRVLAAQPFALPAVAIAGEVGQPRVRAATAIDAPSLAKTKAMARPMPRPPPVIRAKRFSSFIRVSGLKFQVPSLRDSTS